MPASIRGDKSNVRILNNGAIVPWFEITSFEYSESSQNSDSYYVGRPTPETDKLQMGWSGSITGEVKGGDIDSLVQDINNATRAGVQPPQISIVVIEEYPNGTYKTFTFVDVKLYYSNRRQGGAQEKITKSLTFNASDMIVS